MSHVLFYIRFTSACGVYLYATRKKTRHTERSNIILKYCAFVTRQINQYMCGHHNNFKSPKIFNIYPHTHKEKTPFAFKTG